VIQVAIFNTTTYAQVTPTVTFHGNYTPAGFGYDVFQPITPVTLGPGFYQVDAFGFNGLDLNGNLNAGSSSGPILNGGGLLTFTGAGWDYDTSSFDHPSTCPSCQAAPAPQNVQFDAGTFTFTSTPEPGFYGVLAIGLAGLFAAVRRRKNA
jgi:hypothetical protein